MANPDLVQRISTPDGTSDFERGTLTIPALIDKPMPANSGQKRIQQPAGNIQVNVATLINAWDKGFLNLTDNELNGAYREILQNSLEQYEEAELHDFFVYTIINLAIEKSRRKYPNRTVRQIISDAWTNNVQLPLREDKRKADRLLTIYRDAERFLELAQTSLGNRAGGVSQMGAHFASDLLKVMGVDIRTTADPASPAGGESWSGKGLLYGLENYEALSPPLVSLPHDLLRAAELEAFFQEGQENPPKVAEFKYVRIYSIKEGDTLWDLAYRFYGDGRQWERLWEANKASLRSGNPNLIYAGEKIKIY